MNLAHAFLDSAEKNSSKTAVFWGDREYTYEKLRLESFQVGETLLQTCKLQPGDRVALWLKNCPEFLPALFGIFIAGGVVVPINNFLKPDEVSYILRDAGIDVLITDEELGTAFPALKAARPGLQLLKVEEVREGRPFAPVPREIGELAVLIYTSGTTGHPKGAMLSHANLLHNVESCRIVLRTVQADRFAVLLPMFHSYMLTVGLLLPLTVGGSVVIVKSLHPVKAMLQEIADRGATTLPAIPQFYRAITHAPEGLTLPLKLCISGAAPLPVQVLEDFERRFKIPLIEGYGLSEASPVVTKNPLDGRRKPGSIGIPIAHVEVSVQDDSGRMLPDREIGEICVRGGNVMMGYWGKPEESRAAMRGDWLLTGDIGYRDADGYYYITDRKKDMILVNGINVYPREVEEVIYQYPGIKEAAVVGVPDARRGEQPLAFIVPMDGVVPDVHALQHFLREKLADYKVPRRIMTLAALPRNATGKILKRVLKQDALQTAEA